MKKYLLVLFASISLLAEELTFVCDYKISYENFAPTKSYIYWNGQKVDFDEYDIKNLCDQKRWEDAAKRNGDLNFNEDFCKKKERRKIVVNQNSDKFKIDGREYKIKDDIKNRKCFDIGADDKLCEFEKNFVSFHDDKLIISVLTKYQPEWCPVDLTLDDAMNIEDKDSKDTVLKYCFGLFDSTFDGSMQSFTINRSTLAYNQTISNRKLFMKNGELVSSMTRGKYFTSALFDTYDKEEGRCSLFKKQF